MTLRSRQERRAVRRNDREQYERLILNYNEEIENILKNAREKILDELNVYKNVFAESVKYFINTDHH